MIEFILGIIVGILLSIVASFSGGRKEEIIKRVKQIMKVKERGYIAGLSDEEQPIKDFYDSDEDIKIK